MNINSVLKLGFVGDIGLTKAVQSTIDKKGEEYIFSAVKNQLNNYDLLIGNFEGCVSPNWDTFNANNKLCLSPSFIEIFRHVKFDVFSLCNNHILDAGTLGVKTTIETLEKHQYRHFGAGLTLKQAEETLFMKVKGKRIAFIGACDVRDLYAKKNAAGVAPMKKSNLVRRVKEAINYTDVIVVVLHADMEFYRYPSPGRRRLCQTLASLGVNVILQHHPHVVQSSEFIKDCLVIYSIGNFVFPIHGNEYMEKHEGVRNGVIAEVSITEKGKVSLNMKHVYIDDNHRPTIPSASMIEKQNQLSQKLDREVLDKKTIFYNWRQACSENLRSALMDEYYYLRRHGVLKSMRSVYNLLTSKPFWQWILGVVSFGHI